MDVKDLKEVGKQIAVAIFENKDIEEVTYAVGRVLSYLESEQRKRKQLEEALLKNTISTELNNKKMEELQRQLWGSSDKPGLVHVIDAIQKNSEKNSKMLRGIVTMMVGTIVLAGLKLALEHIKI